jgi:hypothetical protein
MDYSAFPEPFIYKNGNIISTSYQGTSLNGITSTIQGTTVTYLGPLAAGDTIAFKVNELNGAQSCTLYATASGGISGAYVSIVGF